MAIVTTANW